MSAAVFATVIAVPLVIDRAGSDTFRTPKELAFRLGSACVLVATVFALTARDRLRVSRDELRSAPIALSIGAVIWGAISTMTSTHRVISAESMVTIIAGALFVIGTYFAARRETWLAIDVALVPAAINAVIVVLQVAGIYQPFRPFGDIRAHMANGGLLGNSNDVGTFLVVPALMAVVAAIHTRGIRRWVYVTTASVIAVGILASATRTALGALTAALIVLTVRQSRKARLALLVALAIGVTLAVVQTTRLGSGPQQLIEAARQRRYEILFSFRLPAFLSTFEMWKDHPITGAGPGTFKYNFLQTKISLDDRYPEATLRTPEFFGEAHNDHLQFLAEGGLPAYAIFLAAVFALVRSAWKTRSPTAEPHVRFAADLAFPAATAIALLMMAQFPFQIAGPRVIMLYAVTLALAWQHREVTDAA